MTAATMAQRRRSKKRAPASYKAHDALILGIDPGSVSGVAAMLGNQLLNAATCDDGRASRDAVVAESVRAAVRAGVPIAGVIESWNPHGKIGHDQLQALAESAGRWIDSLEAFGVHRFVRVQPISWRSAIFGGGPNKTSAQWKQDAIQRAYREWGTLYEADAAEAALMAMWGSRAADVGEQLKARLRAAQGLALPVLVGPPGWADGPIAAELRDLLEMGPELFSSSMQPVGVSDRTEGRYQINDYSGRLIVFIGVRSAQRWGASVRSETLLSPWLHDPGGGNMWAILPSVAGRQAWWSSEDNRAAARRMLGRALDPDAGIWLHRGAMPVERLG
jgi:hypothetical protein